MLDLENVGAELAEPRGDLPEHAGRSGMVRRKETMRSSRSSSRTITEARIRGSMLPPHRMSPTLRPRNLLRLDQHRAQPGGAGALGHGLLQGQVGVDRAFEMRLVDQHDLGDELAHDRQRERAHVLHRDAFRQGRAAERAILAAERVPERRIERRLDPDDLDRGAWRGRRWRCRRSARRRRSGSPGVEVVRVLEHFERDGALPRDHQRVVVGMDEGQGALGGAARTCASATLSPRARPRRRAPASPRPSRTAWSPASRWWRGSPAARRDRRPPGHGCRRTWRSPRARAAASSEASC